MLDDLRATLARAEQLQDPDAALDLAIGVYQHAAGLIALLEEVQAEAKTLITEVLTELAITEADTPSGHCYVTRPSVQVRYDSKALERLIAESEQARALLEPYRKVSERAGVLTIRRRKG